MEGVFGRDIRLSTDGIMLRMTFVELQQWIRDGLRMIEAVDQAACQLPLPPDATTHMNFGQQPLLAQLPRKYAVPASNQRGVIALVDDLVAISLASHDLTEEARIRMQALHVTWLPFHYQPDWFITESESSQSPSGTYSIESGPQAVRETIGPSPAAPGNSVSDGKVGDVPTSSMQPISGDGHATSRRGRGKAKVPHSPTDPSTAAPGKIRKPRAKAARTDPGSQQEALPVDIASPAASDEPGPALPLSAAIDGGGGE